MESIDDGASSPIRFQLQRPILYCNLFYCIIRCSIIFSACRNEMPITTGNLKVRSHARLRCAEKNAHNECMESSGAFHICTFSARHCRTRPTRDTMSHGNDVISWHAYNARLCRMLLRRATNSHENDAPHFRAHTTRDTVACEKLTQKNCIAYIYSSHP